MVRSIIATCGLVVMAITLSFAQKRTNTTPPSWESAVVQTRVKIGELMKQHNFPIVTPIMRYKQAAIKIEADLTGVNELVLSTGATVDGEGADHAAWADAKLIAEDGSVVWLDQIKPKIAEAPYNSPLYNHNFNSQKIAINGKSFDHGIVLHADGLLVYSLGGKYKKLEAEVGIDDGAANHASVIFRIQNVNGKDVVNTLPANYIADFKSFAAKVGLVAEDWITTPDISMERDVILKNIGTLKNKKPWLAKMVEIEKMSGESQMIASLDLLKQVVEISSIAEQLKWVNPKAIRRSLDQMKSNGLKENYDQMLAKLEADYATLSGGLFDGSPQMVATAKEVLNIKKRILLANPLLDIDKIVATRFNLGAAARSAMAPSIGSAANNWSSMYSAEKTGHNGEIVTISKLRTKPTTQIVYKPKRDVNIADLQMHWNADRLLFSSIDDKDRWQVFEVGINGENFQQKILLDEPDLEFCDANFLPDGRIVASSNIGYHGVPCVDGSDPVGNLSLYNPKNGEFRRLTFDQDGNWNPVVMNNGRLMYTRWEYTDLTHYFSRIIMHMNPDGTENKALYGSGSFWPNSIFDVKPLPGTSTQFVAVISGHHGVARSGRLMIFDPVKSRKEEQGVVQELPFSDRKIIPEIKDRLVDDVWPQFIRPCPLDENYFLVSAKLTPTGLWGIYLIDRFDNLTCLVECEGSGFNSPIIVDKKPIPAVIPDRVNLNDKQATIFIQDIYAGEGSMGLPRGVVKSLRILSYEYAYLRSPSDHDAQGIQSGWDIKRLLGTVPVEKDGSVIFKVPANMPISIQPLDQQGRAVQWMRSWFTPMPGETVSCIGCHEDQNQIPIPKRTMASRMKPHELTVPEGGARPFTFELEVQPVLDRTCTSCHNDNSRINLTAGGLDMNYTRPNRMPWGKSYLALMPYIYRQGPEAEMYVLKPYEYHASNSELVRILKDGHHGVELTDNEWRVLYNWIDFNAPYHGKFSNISEAHGFDQYARRRELSKKYNNIDVDWRKEIEDYATLLKAKAEVVPQVPASTPERKSKQIKVSGWPFNSEVAAAKQNKDGKTTRQIEVAPGVMINFIWVPSGEFVVGDNNGDVKSRPEFKASIKRGFWMSECEVTNQQYCTLMPQHNSRIIGQFWKDHTTAGYWANRPQQPVIRVSYDEVVAYCDLLSKKTTLKVEIPTEIEWEWACGAGSTDQFWYGNANSDFAQYENMADAMLSNMAVIGIDPQPMDQDDELRNYWDYIPKIASVNDGVMLTSDVGRYKANPWGLKDMHGNVAEWTSSPFANYPLTKESESDRKVVRGGSWTDRPKYSSSHYRKAFYPWQKVHNVGIRLIIRE